VLQPSTGFEPAERQILLDENPAPDLENASSADLGLFFSTAPGTTGLVISDVGTEGAVSQLGLQEGDRLVSVNGTPVNTEADFMRVLLTPNLRNQQVTFSIMRNGQLQSLQAQPSALIQGMAAADPFFQAGLVLDTSNPSSITVQRVFPRTPAFRAGLRAGDVITTADGQQIANMEALQQALQRANDGQLDLQITRNNRTRSLRLSTDVGARTALRPNLNATTTTPAVTTQSGATTQSGTTTNAGTTTPATGTTLTPRAGTTTPVIPGAAARPGATVPPRVGTPATRPGTPSVTPTSPRPAGTPTSPVPSGTPTRPVRPSGTTPATPATPAAPAGGTGATGIPR
jgi:predicted metalloprotease with PDZ domain